MKLPLAPGLFQRERPRQQSSELVALPGLFPGTHEVRRIYLLAPASAGQALAAKYGIECDQHGASFLLKSNFNLSQLDERLLPFFARPKIKPFLSDLAPFSTWGGTLEHLALGSWLKPVKKQALDKFGCKCVMCGTPQWNASVDELSLRPWLDFKPPTSAPQIGIIKLVALTPMCRDCTLMFRLGWCRVEGLLDKALIRLQALFRLGDSETTDYQRFVDLRALEFTQVGWGMDLSHLSRLTPEGVTPARPLRISSSWVDHYDSEDDVHWLIRETSVRGEQKTAITALFGAPYCVNKSSTVRFQPIENAARAKFHFIGDNADA